MACNPISLAFSPSYNGVCQQNSFNTYYITGNSISTGMTLYSTSTCTFGIEANDGYYLYNDGTNLIWLSVISTRVPLAPGVIKYSGTCYDCVVGYIPLIGTNYYYYDCCGNFIQGTTTQDLEQFYNVNVSNPSIYPYSSTLIIVNTQSVTSCVTPSPTPTLTTTPTLSPTNTPTLTPTQTLTVTPSNTSEPKASPFISYQNDCQVYTSFPMGLTCNVIQNVSTSTSTNGVLQCIVSGGTPPYTYYWNTGSRNSIIYNLSAGTYSVTVVDYYGDYTATTSCVMSKPTLQCNLVANISQVFETSQTPTPTLTQTPTQTLSQTPTNTPTNTQTPTNTPTNTETPTQTPTQSQTPTQTITQTQTQTTTPTNTTTQTGTPTMTPTPTITPTDGGIYS